MSSTIATTPHQALLYEERDRTRRAMPWFIAAAVATIAVLPALGGDPRAKQLLVATAALSCAAMAWLWHMAREPRRYRDPQVSVAQMVAFSGTVAYVVYFGVFSPAVILPFIGIYFVGTGHNRALALGAYAIAAVSCAYLTVAAVTGASPTGLISAESLTTTEKLIGQVLVQGTLLLALLFAGLSRATALESLTALHASDRAVVQREAMVAEMNQDLDRALRSGVPGRLSGQMVGSFRIGELVGRGGMGEVYRAVRDDTDEPAAVKVLHPMFLREQLARERFSREVKLVTSLRSPHIVRVLEASSSDVAQPYLAMELLCGSDLAELLRTRRTLDNGEVVELVRDVASGLQVAADAGIVHRDIKPQNLFRAEVAGDRPVWKILDFGISRHVAPGETLTTGHMMGTPSYMAPEQVRGERASHGSDLYAVAAIAYRAVTGFAPFYGDNVSALVYAVAHEMPRRPSKCASLPPEVDALFAIGLAKTPEARFETGAELVEALEHALAGRMTPELRQRADELTARSPWR